MEKEIERLKSYGFTGFIPVRQLRFSTDVIPKTRGVYIVIRDKTTGPSFLPVGTGGFFKEKNPNVSVSELESNWVEGTKIVYIGKAGDPGKKATLNSRIKQYLRFGKGEKAGHSGGRYIWQLSDAEDLIFAWKPLPEEIPSEIETRLIREFKTAHQGRRPFANLSK